MTHPRALPHGPIEEAFPNVFVVRGLFKAGPGVTFDRNMTIVRTGTELVAINSVRLTDEGEAELAKLGTLKHVVRIGAFHGMDDPYFVERFGATLWGPKGRALTNADKPLDAEVIVLAKAREHESVVLLPDGTLVTCDSYQNWTTLEHCSWIARRALNFMGFGPAMIGGKPWIKKMGVEVRDDLEAVAARSFKHLIPGHGTVLRDHAQAKLSQAIAARFGARV